MLFGLYSATDSELFGWYFATTPGGIRLPYSGGILEVHPPLSTSPLAVRVRKQYVSPTAVRESVSSPWQSLSSFTVGYSP